MNEWMHRATVTTSTPPPRDDDDRLLCGWRVRSAIPLPELSAWSGGTPAPDLTISHGRVAPRIAGGEVVAAHDPRGRSRLELAPDGTVLLVVHGVARFLIVQGTHVVVDAETDDHAIVRLFLLGTVLAVLCYQRRRFPLHASAVDVGGAAVAIAGHSGAGKSTLALSLADRGLEVLADDVGVIDPFSERGPELSPSVCRLKLWRDSLEHLGRAVDPARRVRRDVDKFTVSDVAFGVAPLALSRLYHLTSVSGAPDTTVRQITGIDGVRAVNRMLYRGYIGRAMRLGEWMDRATLALLARVPVFTLVRDAERDDAKSLAGRFLEHVEGATLNA